MSAQPPLQARVQSVVETMKTIGVNDEYVLRYFTHNSSITDCSVGLMPLRCLRPKRAGLHDVWVLFSIYQMHYWLVSQLTVKSKCFVFSNSARNTDHDLIARVTAADRDAFNRVMGLHKDLPHYIAGFQGEPDAYDNFVEMVSPLSSFLPHICADPSFQMVAMKNYARADDTHMVKYAIVQWIPLDPVENPVKPSLVGSRKDDRGWYHPATAKALTPLSLLEQFDRNPT